MALNFITSNPVIDAYDKAEKAANEQRLRDAESALRENQLGELQQTRDSRFRKLEADARLAGSSADYGEQSLPSRVRTSEAGAVKAEGENLDTNLTRPSRLNRIDAESRTAMSNANVGERTEGSRVRGASAAAAHQENQNFKGVLDRLDAGDERGADELARQQGVTIPPDLKTDTKKRAAFRAIYEQSNKVYGSSPLSAQQNFKGHADELQRRIDAGEDPNAVYDTFATRFGAAQQAPGGPAAPVSSQRDHYVYVGNKPDGTPIYMNQTTSEETEGGGPLVPRTGAGAAGGDTALMKNAKFLVDQKVAPDMDTAVRMMRSGLNDSAQTMRLIQAEKKAIRDTRQGMRLPDEEVERLARENIIRRAERLRQTPGGSAAPAVQRPDMMTPGNGGKPLNIEYPPVPPGFPPGTQYNPGRKQWRKPDGSIYNIDGTPVTE